MRLKRKTAKRYKNCSSSVTGTKLFSRSRTQGSASRKLTSASCSRCLASSPAPSRWTLMELVLGCTSASRLLSNSKEPYSSALSSELAPASSLVLISKELTSKGKQSSHRLSTSLIVTSQLKVMTIYLWLRNILQGYLMSTSTLYPISARAVTESSELTRSII